MLQLNPNGVSWLAWLDAAGYGFRHSTSSLDRMWDTLRSAWRRGDDPARHRV